MRPDIGKVDPFPRFSCSLRSNNGLLLLLFLLLLRSLSLVLPVGLCVTQHVLLKFLLAPQHLGSLVLDVLQLLCALLLHQLQLLLVLFNEVHLRLFLFLCQKRIFILGVRCLGCGLRRQ